MIRQSWEDVLEKKSFIQRMVWSQQRRQYNLMTEEERKTKQINDLKKQRYDELMKENTKKYYTRLVKCVQFNATILARRQFHMNFTYDDFKANVHGMGKPSAILTQWLTEMTNPNSSYLEGREHLKGLKFDVFNNKNFTVRFSY